MWNLETRIRTSFTFAISAKARLNDSVGQATMAGECFMFHTK